MITTLTLVRKISKNKIKKAFLVTITNIINNLIKDD